MHKVDGRTSGGQLSGDGAQDFERGFMEREEMPELLLSNGGRPGKATFVIEIIVIDGVRINDFTYTSKYDIVIPIIIFAQQEHELQAIIRDDIFHAHLALYRLLGGAHRPDRQIVYFG